VKTISIIILAVCLIVFLLDIRNGLYEKDKEKINDLFKETEDKIFETKRKLEEIDLHFDFDGIEDEDDDRTYKMISNGISYNSYRRLLGLNEIQRNKGKLLRCPNCGANLQYKNGIAKCKYCDSEWIDN